MSSTSRTNARINATSGLPTAQQLNEAFALSLEERRIAAEQVSEALIGENLKISIYEDRDGVASGSLLLAGEKPSKTSAASASWSLALGEDSGTSEALWRSTLRLIVTGALDPASAEALDQLQIECAELVPADQNLIHSNLTATFEFKMGMVVAGPAMNRVIHLIELYGPEKSCVLITGESGTGKERIAQALHAASKRTGKKVSINCGCIPQELIASELFGHERGAFSGAHNSKLGAFEAADNGTLFLDEIGEMPADQQVALLRVLQEGAIKRVGSNVEKRINVRVVAATNSDLRQLVAQGRFRADLFHRLCGLTIDLPALRDRADEIPALVEHHIAKMSAEHGRQFSVTPEAIGVLQSYNWPGNVRELVQTLDRCRVHAVESVIDLATLESALAHAASPDSMAQLQLSTSQPAISAVPIKLDGTPLADQLLGFEREVVTTALRATSFNQKQAAGLLRTSEPTLRKRMVALGIRAEAAPDYQPAMGSVSQLHREPVAAAA